MTIILYALSQAVDINIIAVYALNICLSLFNTTIYCLNKSVALSVLSISAPL